MIQSARVLRLVVCSVGILVLVGPGCSPSGSPSRWSTRDQSIVPTSDNPTELSATARTLKPLRIQNSNLREAALDVLNQASLSEDPLMRANAIEALEPDTEALRAAVLRGLVDPNEGVRFVATMSIGRDQLCGVSHLLQPLLKDPSASVRAAAIYSLTTCGQEVDLNPLAAAIFGENAADRANAAMILAELGNTTAIPMIRQGMGQDFKSYDPARSRTIDLLMAESVVRLGDRTELEAIRAAMFAPPEHSEMTALACQMVARLDDRVAIPNLIELASGDGPRKAGPELRLVAAAALAKMEPSQVPRGLVIEQINAESAAVRLQVATVLGALGDPTFEPQLTILLNDGEPQVQTAAAAAILRLATTREAS